MWFLLVLALFLVQQVLSVLSGTSTDDHALTKLTKLGEAVRSMGNLNTSPASVARIWMCARKDKQAARAIKVLAKHGLDVRKNGMWRRIAVIPFLSDRRARSYVVEVPSGAKVVKFLREMAQAAAEDPWSVVEARSPEGLIRIGRMAIKELLHSGALVDSLEQALACRWVITQHNPRQNAIAVLGYEIKERTGRLHEVEMFDLLDAVFEAAGKKSPFYSTDTLGKSLQHEMQVRKSGRRKLSQ